MVFLDVSKAFDRVWHKGLIFKLKQFGIEGELLEWISKWLFKWEKAKSCYKKQLIKLEES